MSGPRKRVKRHALHRRDFDVTDFEACDECSGYGHPVVRISNGMPDVEFFLCKSCVSDMLLSFDGPPTPVVCAYCEEHGAPEWAVGDRPGCHECRVSMNHCMSCGELRVCHSPWSPTRGREFVCVDCTVGKYEHTHPVWVSSTLHGVEVHMLAGAQRPAPDDGTVPKCPNQPNP
jgi:hypothetical protein